MTRVLGPAFALVGAFGLVSCGDETSGTTTPPVTTPTATAVPSAPPPTAPAVTAPVPGGKPEITFVNLVHDFGEITDVETYRTSFAFKNTGNGRLTITDVKAACGCTVPTLRKRDFNPGEEGEIEIVFDPKGKKGVTPKEITVVSNASAQPLKLRLTSYIKPLLAYERMHQIGDIQLGEERRETVTFRYYDKDLQISDVSVNHPNITATLKEIGVPDKTEEGDYRATVELTIAADTPWGLLYATRLNVKTYGRARAGADPVQYAYDVFLMGKVYGLLQIQPGLISIGRLSPGGTFNKAAILSSGGQPFEVTGVRIVESPITGLDVKAEPMSQGRYRIVLSGGTGSFRGSIRGIIGVSTNVPGEDDIQVRFSGFVQ